MTLPLRSRALLAQAVGCELLDVERLTSTLRSRSGTDFLARVSGPVQLTFSRGVIHTLIPHPSQLSVTVTAERLGDDPYAERYRLSDDPATPQWLRTLVGRKVSDVRVYLYRDDVPSSEPRQAAVSYRFAGGDELIYGMYIHGRMDGDELFSPSDIIGGTIARTVSVLDPGEWP